jgi:rhodanese-related sulfurtransferase
VVVVRDRDQDLDDVVWQALKVGYDNLVAELSGGVPAWAAAGFPVATTQLTSAPEVAARCGTVLDVRQASEYAAGHVAGSVHVELGALLNPAVVGALPVGPLVVLCGHGERAMSAASLLAAAARYDVTVLAGGPDELAAVTGSPLVRGAEATL